MGSEKDMRRFEWTRFYESVADRLLAFRDRRVELVSGINAIASRVDGLSYLEDRFADGSSGPLRDICPFTVMGIFNRGITDARRKAIASELADLLGVPEPVPGSFEGVPTLNNQKSWFYGYDVDRRPEDIGTLWEAFAQALAFANRSDVGATSAFASAYDNATEIRGVGWNLTMGLYWIRASSFPTLDGRSRRYIAEKLGIDIGMNGPKGRCNASDYLAVVDALDTCFQEDARPVHSFPEVSLAAWQYEGSGTEEDLAFRPITDPDSVKGCYDALQEAVGDEDLWDAGRGLGVRFWESDLTYRVALDRKRIGAQTGRFQVNAGIRAQNDGSGLFVSDGGGRRFLTHTGRFAGTLPSDHPCKGPEEAYRAFRESTDSSRWISLQQDDQRYVVTPIDVDRDEILDNFAAALGEVIRFKELGRSHPRSVPSEGSFGLPETPALIDQQYSIDDVVGDGCFVSRDRLEGILERLRTKKNLILQGPPGTGKTWLARRLAYALMGQRDDSKVRAVQFHPNLSYEDFVRGWRPAGDGRLTLMDGPFVEMIAAAATDPASKHVVVIEEINRGNPAQILGEMLTLLEVDKRTPGEALELSYRKAEGERIFIPDNLYVIGTMNVADRSLALVDLALRRRFAFIDLEPTLGQRWRDWVQTQCGIDSNVLVEIEKRLDVLNGAIAADAALGPQFRIGHSYVTPPRGVPIPDAREWFRQVVDTEIAPLLDEYWFDALEKSRRAKDDLLAGF